MMEVKAVSLLFSLINLLIIIGLIGGTALLIFFIIRAVSRKSSINQEPVSSGHAIVTDKRTHVWGSGNQHAHSTSYYVTFEFENGERREFMVSGKEHGQVAQGDTGTLTYQGTRFHDFQRVSG